MKKAVMKIVGVSGSPRKGNTEWMLGKLCEELSRGGADVEMLLLRKMDVKMCRGCLACEKGGRERQGDCKIKDDMAAVYPKLLAADAIVLATPGYMGRLSGRLKNFLDLFRPQRGRDIINTKKSHNRRDIKDQIPCLLVKYRLDKHVTRKSVFR